MKTTYLAILVLFMSHSSLIAQPAPPIAPKKPVSLVNHGVERIDEYYWMNDREDQQVLDYLHAENTYTEEMTAHIQGLSDEVFEEMKGRIKQDDNTVPYFKNGYWYYTRYEEGKEYPIYVRKKGSMDAAEEIMLNVNEEAEKAATSFYQVGGVSVSPDTRYLAFAADTMGRRIYTIRVKDLETGAMLPDLVENVSSNLTWATDNQTLFYTRQDPETLRMYQVFKHRLDQQQSEDVLVYEEKDEEFYCYVYRTKSDQYLVIGSEQTLSTEMRFLKADQPEGEWTVFAPRERNHEYSIEHFGDNFYIRTNRDGATNFKLMKTPLSDTGTGSWAEVLGHREDVYLSSFELFNAHLVVVERKDALTHMRVIPWDGSEEHYLDFGEPAYRASLSTNVEFDTPVLRFGYTSMTTPFSTYDYNMITREKTLLKQTEVLGGFSSDDYVTERKWVTARDGVKVPISLVYHKNTTINGTAPLLLYGYGSYGASMDASFNSARLSLLDRGFVYAIAHIRGGQEMGRQWYEDGKLLNKRNTFNDFIDAAEYVVDEGYSAPDKLFALGGSAGGLLMGAVINDRPDLFRGVVAAVPFVDVVTTMLDDTIPLTTFEYDEWGNPNDSTYFDYMLSYSPYDNVVAQAYPNLLVTSGLHDSQVQYWEPTKWVAKLRETKTDNNVLLLKTNMDAGHGGASGRFEPTEGTCV